MSNYPSSARRYSVAWMERDMDIGSTAKSASTAAANTTLLS